MSAETLRRAASQMREDWPIGDRCPDQCSCNDVQDHYHPGADFHNGVADWLDEVAERQAPTFKWGSRSHGWTGARPANAVARAYLGEDA